MEIFQDGELEADITKHELNATDLGSWWTLFSTKYQEMVQSIATPVRAVYSIHDLGETELRVDTGPTECQIFVREDFYLRNARKEQLACSFWRRKDVRDADPIVKVAGHATFESAVASEKEKVALSGYFVEQMVQDHTTTNSNSRRQTSSSSRHQQKKQCVDMIDPCIVYLHGMSSSRKECVYLHRQVLAKGFSLFAMDFSGSGLSDGDRVSFGAFERDDVRTVLDYLYATSRASAVGIWGRDIGSVAALLHVKERMSYHYTTMTISEKDAEKITVVEDEATHHLLCIPSLTGPRFWFNKYSATNGDFVLLAIDTIPVQTLSPATCYHLIQRSCKINDGKARLRGFKRSSNKCELDPFVFALAADCAYGDMEQVIRDMLQMITKSAERRNLFVPSLMVTMVQKVLSNSIGKAGEFSFCDVRLLDAVPHFSLPCLFLSASKKDFFMPEHTKLLYDQYGGSKSYIQFTGQINDNRPSEVVDNVISHFTKQLKLVDIK